MQSVEAKLAAYRARQPKRDKNLLQLSSKEPQCQSLQETHANGKEAPSLVKTQPTDSSKDLFKSENEVRAASSGAGCYSSIQKIIGYKRLTFALKLVLWLLLLGLCVELEFAAVFIITSVFYAIYVNMRNGPRRDGAPSAYSVFNPNCERIDGTFTTEQFERELRYGAAAVGQT